MAFSAKLELSNLAAEVWNEQSNDMILVYLLQLWYIQQATSNEYAESYW